VPKEQNARRGILTVEKKNLKKYNGLGMYRKYYKIGYISIIV